MGWTAEIDALVEKKHILKHPFYTAWTEGTLTMEALRGYAGQYYRHVLSFPTYISAVHSETPDLGTRQYLLENLIDEERGEENHPELWLRFAEGIGCRREDVRLAAEHVDRAWDVGVRRHRHLCVADDEGAAVASGVVLAGEQELCGLHLAAGGQQQQRQQQHGDEVEAHVGAPRRANETIRRMYNATGRTNRRSSASALTA